MAFVFSSVSLFSQTSSPIIGYDKVAWGASIQVVSQHYPGVKEKNSEDASLGVREFEQRNISGSIDIRIFYFYQGKLFGVRVLYDEMDNMDNVASALQERIRSVYGEFDDIYEETGTFRKDYYFLRYYNKNLTIIITIHEVYNIYNYLIETVPVIDYVDPIVYVPLEEAKRKEKADKLDL